MSLLILLADDDLGIRVAVQDYLELHGYSVIAAKNGEEALAMMETYHPHLLVSDIRMPLSDGYDLVRRMRERPEFRLIPVIFLTERKSTEERIKGYQVGCDAYLPKPFEMAELQAVIRNLLERSQMVQSELRFANRGTSSAPSRDKLPRELRSQKEPMLSLRPSLNFTLRESEVLNLLTTGLSNGDIGLQLHLSARTIEKYVSSLLRKTETSNRAELVRFALDHQLID
jgi:DNA-binding NarL/FixJ family response regulator